VQPYRRPTNLPHLPEARRHLPHAVRLKASHYRYNDYKKAQRCWTNDSKSDPTRYTECMPASTSRRRQSWKNGTTRHVTPFKRDTDRNDSWLLPSNLNHPTSDSCKWCSLLLVAWCGGLCGALVSEAMVTMARWCDIRVVCRGNGNFPCIRGSSS